MNVLSDFHFSDFFNNLYIKLFMASLDYDCYRYHRTKHRYASTIIFRPNY